MIKRLCQSLIVAIAITSVNYESEALKLMIPEPQIELEETYTETDVFWLSRLIYAESGSDACSDDLQLAVGSVVLNRVESDLYPNTIEQVIFDTHWGVQYGCTKTGMIWFEPNQRAIKNAKYLLENGSVLPGNVLGQSDCCTLNYIYTIIDGVVFSAL